jgi:predicted peroxiredoxin
MEGFTDAAPNEAQLTDAQDNLQVRQQISLGMDMEIFLRSDVGRLLTRRAAAEIAALREQMDTIESTDAVAIRNVQLEIATRKVWKDWIERAIQEGVAAQDAAIDRNSL